MSRAARFILANWTAIAAILTVAAAVGAGNAQLQQMRQDVEALRRSDPTADLQRILDGRLRAMQSDLAQTREDVAFIRGRLEPRR